MLWASSSFDCLSRVRCCEVHEIWRRTTHAARAEAHLSLCRFATRCSTLARGMDVLPPPTLSEDVLATLNAASRLAFFALSKIYSTVRFSPRSRIFSCSAGDEAASDAVESVLSCNGACGSAHSATQRCSRSSRADVRGRQRRWRLVEVQRSMRCSAHLSQHHISSPRVPYFSATRPQACEHELTPFTLRRPQHSPLLSP